MTLPLPVSDARPLAHAADLAADALRGFLQAHRRVFVLTGAGVSTGSGIPDYRDADGQWKRSPPITYQAFVHDARLRARYWARSFVGWPIVAQARPNPAHAALARLQAQGRLAALATQIVDGLHTRAGHREVIDLHGRIDRVVCLDCGASVPRSDIQRALADSHPQWACMRATAAPDGDADLEHMDLDTFQPPLCARCGGLLKPDVVFFGENVPRPRVAAAQAALAAADALLVVGSSLMVYSGYRFARLARERDLPVALLTRGVTRADDIATLKIDAECGQALAAAAS